MTVYGRIVILKEHSKGVEKQIERNWEGTSVKLWKLCVILMLCLCMAGCVSEEEKTYNAGVEAMQAEDWDGAIAYFADLGFSDSEDLLAECRYELGKSAMDNQEWAEAISYFNRPIMKTAKTFKRFASAKKV